MKKQLTSILLGGAILFSPLCTSCTNDDIDSLDERVSVLEGMIRDLKSQLEANMVTGSTITNATQSTDGTWTLKLSDGSTITIAPSSAAGASVTVEETDAAFIITVNGTEYVLGKGAAVSSLVFVDEYGDGKVALDSKGAAVSFLVEPKLSAEEVAAATFAIADAREVKTRAGEDLMEVSAAAVDGDLVKLTIIGTGVEAGKTYVVSVKMSAKGTTLCSNYFRVEVANDFSFDAEALEDPKMKNDVVTDFEPKGEGFWTATMPDPLGTFNFKDYYAELPAGEIEFTLAPAAAQNPAVQGRYEVFKEALSKDGSWEFKQRPGTSGYDETNNGVLIYMKADKQIKNKIYWKIHDPLGGLDFQALNGLAGNFESELYGREGGYVEAGTSLCIPEVFYNYETDIPIRHGGSDAWFAAWKNYSIKDGENEVIFNDGTNLVVHDDYKKYLKHSRGIEWFYRGFMIVVPENMATEDGKYIASNGKAYSGGEGYGYDTWGPGSAGEWFAKPNWYQECGNDKAKWADFGIVLDPKTGVITFPETYTGWGVRIAFSAAFQYAFGEKTLVGTGTDQLGMLFFNRRVAGEGATMPEPFE